jgi:hypothetical protein
MRAGSAAFNLLGVISVCMAAPAEGVSKRVAAVGVFTWSSAISVLAYVWLLVVYKWWTPDVRAHPCPLTCC